MCQAIGKKKTNLVSVKTLKDPVNKNHMFRAR